MLYHAATPVENLNLQHGYKIKQNQLRNTYIHMYMYVQSVM